jgi:hypothetical protein
VVRAGHPLEQDPDGGAVAGAAASGRRCAPSRRQPPATRLPFDAHRSRSERQLWLNTDDKHNTYVL